MKLPPCLLAAALCAGCVNPYARFYAPRSAGVPLQPPQVGGPEVIIGATAGQIDDARRAGYVCIGEASFHGVGRASASAAREQGKRVGADLILISLTDRGQRDITYSVPDYQPPQTHNSVVSGSVLTSAGSATYYGNVQTTTPGYLSSHNETITVQDRGYSATFWRKAAAP